MISIIIAKTKTRWQTESKIIIQRQGQCDLWNRNKRRDEDFCIDKDKFDNSDYPEDSALYVKLCQNFYHSGKKKTVIKGI